VRGWLAATVALVAFATEAHPEGFHAKYAFTLTKTTLVGLLVLDVDGGSRCELIRAGADADHDGKLSVPERRALETKLASFITRPLKLGISSAPLPLTIKESKLNLHDDPSVSKSGLSVALLLEVNHPYEISPGMHFELEASTPDQSHLRVEVVQAIAAGERPEPDFVEDVPSGKKVRVRLGLLAKDEPARGARPTER